MNVFTIYMQSVLNSDVLESDVVLKGSSIVYMYMYETKMRHHNSKHCDICRSYVKNPLTFVVIWHLSLMLMMMLWRLLLREDNCMCCDIRDVCQMAIYIMPLQITTETANTHLLSIHTTDFSSQLQKCFNSYKYETTIFNFSWQFFENSYVTAFNCSA